MTKKLILKYTPHWYFVTEYYCPICAHTKQYRERRYGKKPDNYNETHERIDNYDWCNE